MNWKSKVAVITGASAGIGRATALAVGKLGVSVVLAARRKSQLEEVAKQIGTALPVVADISNEQDVERLIDETIKQFSRIDILINNAGSGLYAKVEETTPEQMERMWRVNFLGSFYCIRRVIPIMKKQGSGHIITVSSMAGVRGIPYKSAYCASKFAQIGLMDSLRRELQGVIHCTTILPGATESEFISSMENPKGRNIDYSGPPRKPTAVADAIVDAIEHPTARKITQKHGTTLAALNAISPDLTDWLVQKLKKETID